MRYVVWIAGISESSNLWTHVALSWSPPESTFAWVPLLFIIEMRTCPRRRCRRALVRVCVCVCVGADDTGFVLLLRSLVLLCSALAAAAAGGLCVRVCVWHMALDSSLFQLFLSFSLSLPHGRHAHSARVVFYEGGAMALKCPFRVEAWGFVCGSVCACVRACVRHYAPRSLSVSTYCEWMCV